MLLTLSLTTFLLVATIGTHYEVLRFASTRLTRIHVAPRLRIIVMLVAALASHLLHVLYYAAAFVMVEHYTSLGTIAGPAGHSFDDAFYFSMTCYTTLGIGDLYPTGTLRILSGVEALNGLVMVGWTASLTYLYMEKFWKLHGRADPR
jgi:hypothetical protein